MRGMIRFANHSAESIADCALTWVECQSRMKSNLYTAEEGMQHHNKLTVSS